MKKTVGIVLAGGLSRRFGSPKAFARIDMSIFMSELSMRWNHIVRKSLL